MDLRETLGISPEQTNFVFLGEAGCGKSEIAVNLAHALVEGGETVHFFDLDMTKPLFRSRDQKTVLQDMGIQFHYEEQFMDAPTLTGGVRRMLRDNASTTILDVGGDYIGARSIGGYAALLNRADTLVYYVINPFRPWSGSMEHIDKVLGEILGVSHVDLQHVRLIGNPNLGLETTPEDVVQGTKNLLETVAPYKPFDFFCVWDRLEEAVRARLNVSLFPLQLYFTYPWSE